jgi:hypothetical protein
MKTKFRQYVDQLSNDMESSIPYLVDEALKSIMIYRKYQGEKFIEFFHLDGRNKMLLFYSLYETGEPHRLYKYKKKPKNTSKKSKKFKKKKKIYTNLSPSEFYATDRWRKLRYLVLKANNGRCELCGNGKFEGAVLHVDHIKPRSKFPSFEWDINNLQVLCSDCNLGKSNTDSINWKK